MGRTFVIVSAGAVVTGVAGAAIGSTTRTVDVTLGNVPGTPRDVP